MLRKKTKLYVAVMVVFAMLLVVFSGCASEPAPAPDTDVADEPAPAPDTDDDVAEPAPEPDEQFVIGFTNSSVSNSWAAAYFNVAVNALGELDNVIFYTADGNDSSTKQIADVEDLLARNIDLLIIRPDNPEALSAVVEKVYDAGIPVVVSGRTLSTEKYTTFVMLDDVELGRRAATHAVKLLEEKFGEPRGKVFELQGAMQAGSAISRHNGIMEIFEQYPDIELVAQQPADYQRAMGRTVTENVLQAQPEIDLVISHAGEMTVGALEAYEAAGREGESFMVAIDGYNGVLLAMAEGKVDFTVLYPVELGAETVRVAMKILQGEEVPKIWEMPIFEVTPDNVDDYVNYNAPDSAWTF